jgi:hypothetical protein
VGQIFVFVKESLPPRQVTSRSKQQVCVDEALECVRMFVQVRLLPALVPRTRGDGVMASWRKSCS